ncbi:MAG: group II intron reverse transcriptase/maturase, partial [Thaumarchaeota archaeon]|nr:group II intron reverse transcriptase/maturase [Nitrososphaerota archaeon]
MSESKMTLYNEIALHENLYRGWVRVDSNDGSPGVDNVTLDEFALSLQDNLSKLEKELSTFTYQPQPLIRYDIPKPNGKIRVLAVPTVRDRVAQSSALIILQPVIEREFEKCSFAFRPGLSRFTAIDEIHKLRDDGYLWIVDADIESFFDNVDHSTLLNRLQELIKDNEVIALTDKWIKSDVMYHGIRSKRDKGLPQGAVISPILANLYLDKFDEELLKQGLRLVRFADDFVILCKSKPKAEEALKLSEAVLNELELHLNREKTKVTTFDEGFKYLGALFIKDLILPTKMHDTTPFSVESSDSTQNQPSGTSGRITFGHVDQGMNSRSAGSVEEKIEKTSEQTNVIDAESQKKNQNVNASGWQKTLLGEALLKALDEKPKKRLNFLKSQSLPDTRGALQEESDSKPAPAALQPPEPSEEPDERETIPVAEELPSSTDTSPFMRTLYIQEQGCWLRIEGEKFVITTGGKETIQLLQILAIKVEQILIFGACIITPAAMRYCLTHNIPLTNL